MPEHLLTVDFRDGFFDEPVVVRVGGQEIFRDTVRTRMQTGLARRVTHSASAGTAVVEIELPGRGVRETRDLDLTTPHFVGVTLEQNGTLVLVDQRDEFHYA